MEEKYLFDQLIKYNKSDFYPFHMPGHKRQTPYGFEAEFPNPFSIDITEIHGFDNLHCPEGILKDSMEQAAAVYGADKTYYLVNGSSSGVLSAVCGCVARNGKILAARNCHKSVYNGIFLKNLESRYIYPQFIDNFGINGGLFANDVDNLLSLEPDIQAVLITSPTYDGIVSDVEAIAHAAHRHGVPLLVDEAHGAHFPFGSELPQSALDLGADVVIQSVHKTLPSLTQTALLHIKGDLVRPEQIERYLSIFQSSSPSYVMMASIEQCIKYMDGQGRVKIKEFMARLKGFRDSIGKMKHLRLLNQDMIGRYGVFNLDITKIVISTREAGVSGAWLSDKLRTQYHLELEMCGADYVVALTSLMDTEGGLERLKNALLEIDGALNHRDLASCEPLDLPDFQTLPKAQPVMRITEAMEAVTEAVSWQAAVGRVSGEFVYLYPPGIPIAAPGEILTEKVVERIISYKKLGLSVQGTKDRSLNMVLTVK